MSGSEHILDYTLISCGIESCIHRIIGWIFDGGETKTLVCANPHSLVQANRDEVFRSALQAADMIVPDGAGIVLASRILNGRIRKRVTGSDVFRGLNDAMNQRGQGSCFFLGSTEWTLLRICEKMAKDYPKVKVVGTYSPPFKSEFTKEDSRQMIAAVNTARPDVLWVGMTAPKQEKWIFQNKKNLNVKFIAAVGAVFDFYTGNVKRSHPVFQRLGLEWLPRLLRQPGRLWGRTIVSAPVFIYLIFKQRLFLNKVSHLR